MAEIIHSSYNDTFTNSKRSRFPGSFGGWNRPAEGDRGGGLVEIHTGAIQSLNQIQNKKESCMNHIIQESILEYKATYSVERLFGASIPRAFIKSIKESVKCFIKLIKPHNYEYIF